MRTIAWVVAVTALLFTASDLTAGEGHIHRHGKEVGEKAAESGKLAAHQKCCKTECSEECCKGDAENCEGCGLNKGSMGRGKSLKAAKGEEVAALCPKCGEVKACDKCCKAGAEKCEKCGLNLGSPGCCKMASEEEATAEAEGKPQTMCPVMEGKIDKKYYADHNGKRVYFCCAGCVGVFEKNPEKYVKALEAEGIVLEKAPEEE
jgi:YHS domain-containing protein